MREKVHDDKLEFRFFLFAANVDVNEKIESFDQSQSTFWQRRGVGGM